MPYSGENMSVVDSNLFEDTHILFSNRLLKYCFTYYFNVTIF